MPGASDELLLLPGSWSGPGAIERNVYYSVSRLLRSVAANVHRVTVPDG